MQYRVPYSSRLGLVAVLLAVGWVSWIFIERPRGFNRLHGRLRRVEVQFESWPLPAVPASPWRGQWVGTDDPVFLDKVEAWLRELHRPACCNALKQCGGSIVLTFRDGRQEEILFRGPNRPGLTGSWCSGFIWEGLDVVGGEEPFTAFLRALGVESRGATGADKGQAS
jgi:hypothetical protein